VSDPQSPREAALTDLLGQLALLRALASGLPAVSAVEAYRALDAAHLAVERYAALSSPRAASYRPVDE
jgi:hypothetical protein